jgi:glutathione synthase/RimK-type ligase-like ATP-grasp enzyme
MILILSNPDDPHAVHIAGLLRERGARYAWVCHRDFPTQARVSVRYVDGRPHACWRTGDQEIDLSALTAIWNRRPFMPAPDAAISEPKLRAALTEECDLYLRDLWSAVGCLTVPAPSLTIRQADLKATQLAVAARLGLEIPDTLIGNDPDELLRFYRDHDGQVISKLASPPLNRDFLDPLCVRYTEVISHRDLTHYRAARLGPVIVQGYVPKKVELRITLIGDDIFPVEIHSQRTRRTQHDWRHYDHDNTPLHPHPLPAEVEARLRALMRHFGLSYGAIDMIVTPDDRYVFLELNPNGQFLWIEQLTGLPMSDALCDLLQSGERR